MKWYHLDPDYRPNPPAGGARCTRCQKAIKNVQKAVKVFVMYERMDHVRLADDQDVQNLVELVGIDCWEKIRANPV